MLIRQRRVLATVVVFAALTGLGALSMGSASIAVLSDVATRIGGWGPSALGLRVVEVQLEQPPAPPSPPVSYEPAPLAPVDEPWDFSGDQVQHGGGQDAFGAEPFADQSERDAGQAGRTAGEPDRLLVPENRVPPISPLTARVSETAPQDSSDAGRLLGGVR